MKVRDLITDIGDANVGAIVLDSAAILCGIGTFSSLQCSICNHSQPYNIGEIGLLIAESAWAGPIGILGGALLVAKIFIFPEKSPLERYADNDVKQYEGGKYYLIDLPKPEPPSGTIKWVNFAGSCNEIKLNGTKLVCDAKKADGKLNLGTDLELNTGKIILLIFFDCFSY